MTEPIHPATLLYGRTATDENVPVLVDADGKIVTTGGNTNPFDQDLNTDDTPTLAGLTLTGALTLTTGVVTSGTYTPTRSAESNLDSNVTPTAAQYLRVGATVTVSGRFTADPTGAGAASFELTLPVASNLGAAADLAGVAFCGGIAGQGAEIIGSAANNTAVVQWVAVDTTSKVWSYTFTYQII